MRNRDPKQSRNLTTKKLIVQPTEWKEAGLGKESGSAARSKVVPKDLLTLLGRSPAQGSSGSREKTALQDRITEVLGTSLPTTCLSNPSENVFAVFSIYSLAWLVTQDCKLWNKDYTFRPCSPVPVGHVGLIFRKLNVKLWHEFSDGFEPKIAIVMAFER